MNDISKNTDWLISYWYIQGLSTTEIGKKVGMHRSSIYRRFQTNSVQAIVNSFRNEMYQNLFAGMLGLGREMISSYQQKVKDKTVYPADMNGFFLEFYLKWHKKKFLLFLKTQLSLHIKTL